MEEFEEISAKLRQAAQLFHNLGIVSQEMADEYGNVKLMKLIYLFFMEYRAVCEQQQYNITEEDSLNNYIFYAYPLGPVEKTIYDNIGTVKYFIQQIPFDQGVVWDAFLSSNIDALEIALKTVHDHFLMMTTNEIVAYTHYCLAKWRVTPPDEKMEFTQNDYNIECKCLNTFNDDTYSRVRSLAYSI